VFHAKRDSATKANAHLAHLQAQTHKADASACKRAKFNKPTVEIDMI